MTWLPAQLDDDERVARQLIASPGGFHLEAETDDTDLMAVACHVFRWDPARVLAEVEAKRRIVDEHAPDRNGYCPTCDDNTTMAPCPTVRFLGLPYAGRPGYRDEWKP